MMFIFSLNIGDVYTVEFCPEAYCLITEMQHLVIFLVSHLAFAFLLQVSLQLLGSLRETSA